jgi:hypothetical protein
MVSRKRGRQEMEADEPPREPTMLQRLRSMWEFANLAEYIFIFGKAVKLDEDFDIEVHSLWLIKLCAFIGLGEANHVNNCRSWKWNA